MEKNAKLTKDASPTLPFNATLAPKLKSVTKYASKELTKIGIY
jgi:hypothetical protein